MKDNAVYEKRATYRRCCWYVHTEVLSRFGQEALPVPCQWTYFTAGAREESREEPQAATGSQGNSPTTPQTSSTTPSSSNKRKSTGSMSITKFMRRCPDRDKVEEHDFYSIVQALLNNPTCTSIVGEKDILIYSFIVQTETTEADGFQADTEDDDDEDCVLISTQSGELHKGNTNISLS